jgi:putative addiction module component (TIGR02574 family)
MHQDYPATTREQLTEAILALPLPERVSLAQDLWQSIDEGGVFSGPAEEREALAEAQRRDAELSSGTVAGRTHEQVMEAMRQAIECA